MNTLLLVAVLLPALAVAYHGQDRGIPSKGKFHGVLTRHSRQPCTPFSTDNINCPTGYTAVHGNCLQFMTDVQVTWEDARKICIERGGYLVALKTTQMMQAVVQHINEYKPAPGDGYWTGASDAGSEGYWYWQDFSPVTMGVPFWGVWNNETDIFFEPTGGLLQNCAFLYTDYRYYLYDKPCSDADKHPLCQTEPL